jgi:hypothetical protein
VELGSSLDKKTRVIHNITLWLRMRRSRDKRATRSPVLPIVGERKGGSARGDGEVPKGGSRDKIWSDGRD